MEKPTSHLIKEAYEKYGFIDGPYRKNLFLKNGSFCLIPLKELEGCKVLDAGCGVGSLSRLLLESINCEIVLLDIAGGSLKKAKKNVNAKGFICGDVIHLPFKDGVFDWVISNGVIHHTVGPEGAFRELVRVSREGMYVSVYNKFNFYFVEFHTMGRVFRSLGKGNRFFVRIFQKLLSLVLKEDVNYEFARSLFADRYLTPQATFHTKKELENWGRKLNLSLEKYTKKTFGMLHQFYFRKPEEG